MIPVQFGVDIFEELGRLGYDRFIVPLAVIRELEILVKKLSGKERMAAKVALSLAQRCETADVIGYADDVVIELATEHDAAVLTNDAGLKKRLQARHISVICLRQKNRLSNITDEI